MGSKRGEAEGRAIDFVKRSLSGGVDSAQCGDGPDRRINRLEGMFGFSNGEVDRFSRLLFSVEPNRDLSSFPDYICPEGFIEHFRVTASLGKKKRSEYLKRHAALEKRVEQASERMVESHRSMQRGALWNVSVACEQPVASYSDFVASFEESWKNHMSSRRKFLKENDACQQAFLVEMPQFGLEMFEIFDVMNLEGRSFGDLYRPEHLKNYRLSRDKKLLGWIWENAEGLDCVIFLGPCGEAEVINISMIPTITELIRWDYCIAGGPAYEMCSIAAL